MHIRRQVSRGIQFLLKLSEGPINRSPDSPRTENIGIADPWGLNKSMPHCVNRSPGDQNSQA